LIAALFLSEARVGLRGAAHVGEQRADRGQHRRHHGNLAREAILVAMLRGVFELVIVRTVDVKTAFRHGKTLLNALCGR
jgi:hypothetical protein